MARTLEVRRFIRGRRHPVGPRQRSPSVSFRAHFSLPMLGEDVESGGRMAYIGQSDDVATRLRHHEAGKDFWTEVVVITSKDLNLTSAHVRYLEARLVRLVKAIGRVPLENGNEPTGGADLPEAGAVAGRAGSGGRSQVDPAQ